MKNKRFFTLLIACVMLMSSLTVSAAEPLNNSINDTEPAFIIEVKDTEELNELLAEIESNNARANALWEAALEESKNTPQLIDSQISPYGVFSNTSTATFTVSMALKSAIINTNVSYDRVNNGSYYIFGTIYGVNVWARNNEPISNLVTNYTRIDNQRVLAVNYSFVVGINTGSSTLNTQVTKYIEFNANGTHVVY